MQWNDLSFFTSSAAFIHLDHLGRFVFKICSFLYFFFFFSCFFRVWKVASLASCLCICFGVFSHRCASTINDYTNGSTSTQNDFSLVKFHILFSYTFIFLFLLFHSDINIHILHFAHYTNERF